MAQYSKSFEREENRLMNKGVTRSVLALVLFWVPLVSLILAISGFIRVGARVTRAHRVKKFFMLMLTLIVFLAVLGSHIYAVYVYVRNPGIVDELLLKGWTALTGEETLPWKAAPAGADEDMYEREYYDEDYDDGYDEDYDDGDADFDDRELLGFEEDDEGDYEADPDSVKPSGDDASTTDSLDLYYQLKSEKGLSSRTPMG